MKWRFALLAAVPLLTACALSAQTPPAPPTPSPAPAAAAAKPDPWAALRFLVGTWEAKTTGGVAQAQASSTYAFRLELRDHVMERHSSTGACGGPDEFDCRHSDLLYIYPGTNEQGFQAIFFDNEGHVIHYDVSSSKAGEVVFLSDSAQPGPQFRLTYELVDDVMTGKFELKAPGQADFMSYLEWSGKRK
jgi:hypothetical protein